jgi:predicted transcriptional regulator
MMLISGVNPATRLLKPNGQPMAWITVVALLPSLYKYDIIAERLGITRQTVRNHIKEAERVTGLRGRVQLGVWAEEAGIAMLEEEVAARQENQ